ncbi:phosphate acyltransferase PlsX [Rickettsiales bacterium]|nr:phosphate acyltransferase PlsX [Rickettsiales bacterium]
MVSSSVELTVALDAMGGDNAPLSVLKGADRARKKYPNIKFLLYGNKNILSDLLASMPKLKECSTICHSENEISVNDKPSVALRKGKNSSMRLAIDSVKSGKSSAVVSAGNTGALMAMAKLVLRTLPGIDRPAITSIFPTRKGRCVLLDLGANIDCNSDNLVQFAIMGDAFAKVILDIPSPTIGLLNVGVEDIKGSEVVKSAAEELREGEYPLNFQGFVEGDDIAGGKTDVVVTDGFTGNVALKTAEGTAKICSDFVKQAFKGSPLAFLGGILASRSLKKTFRKLDPRLHNGAMFLGLNGIAVKSHGGTDDIGFANAISVAVELAANNINEKITQELAVLEEVGIEDEYDEEQL